MPALETKLNARSVDFQTNAAAMRALVDDLQAQIVKAAAGGGEAARVKHIARGKLLLRERVQMLLDAGTPFLELSPMAAHGLYDNAAPCAGVITGIGRVSGVDCMIVCSDATVKGGTYYPMTVKKHLRARKNLCSKTGCRAFTWSIPAVPICPTRTMCFPTATISAASFSTRPT